MKVRLGVGGMAVTKRRDVSDAETFIVKESEESILKRNDFCGLISFHSGSMQGRPTGYRGKMYAKE